MGRSCQHLARGVAREQVMVPRVGEGWVEGGGGVSEGKEMVGGKVVVVGGVEGVADGEGAWGKVEGVQEVQGVVRGVGGSVREGAEWEKVEVEKVEVDSVDQVKGLGVVGWVGVMEVMVARDWVKVERGWLEEREVKVGGQGVREERVEEGLVMVGWGWGEED